MLPKVANQILHHTSRAVAAVQNQTGQTIRNVLQLQTSSGPSSAAGNLGAWNTSGSSSSGWGSSGPGAGGAKHSSSRFHSSYTGVGRAATLVDPSISHASNVDSFDDPDEQLLVVPLRSRRRQRSRSSSLSFSIQDRDEQIGKIGVLKTVQLHLRARHAFAAPPLPAIDTDSTPKQGEGGEVPEHSHSPQDRPVNEEIAAEERAFRDINAAKASGDVSRVLAEVKKYGDATPPPSAAVYNSALQALISLRAPGQPLHHILETYHQMIARSVIPNFRTYTTLILVLAERDNEVHHAVTLFEARVRRHAFVDDPTSRSLDQERIAQLKSENNFGSALTLFQAACMIPRTQIPLTVYRALMHSCASHGNVEAAIHVYAHLEKRRDIAPSAAIFKDLIRVYTSTNDLQGAKEVFSEYRTVAQSGRLGVDENSGAWRRGSISVWNEMIEAYFRCGHPASGLELLEEMMDSPRGLDFGIADVPLPASSTFSCVIKGFIHSDDVSSALAWFQKLLGQQYKPVDTFQPVLNPPQPDTTAWNLIFDALIANNMYDDIIRVFNNAHPTQIPHTILVDVIGAYHQYRIAHPEPNEGHLDKVMNEIRKVTVRVMAEYSSFDSTIAGDLCIALCQVYAQHGRLDCALDVAEEYASLVRADLQTNQATTSADAHPKQKFLRGLVEDLTSTLLAKASPSNWTLKDAMRLSRLAFVLGAPQPRWVHIHYIQTYMQTPSADRDNLTKDEWQQLILVDRALIKQSNTGHGDLPVRMLDIMVDVIQRGILKSLDRWVVRLAMEMVDAQDIHVLMDQFGDLPSVQQTLKPLVGTAQLSGSNLDVSGELKGPSPQHVRIDLHHAKFVDEYYPNNPKVSPLIGFRRFEMGARKGLYPTPEIISKLINSLGRLGEVDKVRALYSASQAVLATLEDNKQWQSVGWFGVEDAMIIALAHSGDTDGAHVHRARILEQGGSPSADAYGALIQCVKDTTDDTSNAMALFQEALSRGVSPNIYLYNTAISKLAKARKADHALLLFQEMKLRGVRPTSVTYGAVIAACCRVGDAQSAEVLFQEMSTQTNFKPRVPPYNTMMQLYTHTKPDRERVLHYYNALLEANVRPTAHTYKLLIDAYGTIEPLDTDAMGEAFNSLVADAQVPVQGTHWAALINAWGCVRKDLDKAVGIFDSIKEHPSTKSSQSQLPDAVVFEALMNVLVTLRRSDLIPVYSEKMASYGVHMTAYIANLLIKGYAATGDIEKAREIFEGLADPPEGVAAPNNHAPHDNEPVTATVVPTTAPVYREPSTWEVMVRAELGNGNREQAVALLERVQARRFPAAVYNRISGIMLDDSVSPWASTPESSSLASTSASSVS